MKGKVSVKVPQAVKTDELLPSTGKLSKTKLVQTD